jgi:DNA-directed RNA polymerase subunit RPC12/RpoP
MTEKVLIAISPSDVGGRQVFNTGLSTVGRADKDYLCGHCGHKMMTNFDCSRIEIDLVFQCGSCGGHNLRPEDEPIPAPAVQPANDDGAEG